MCSHEHHRHRQGGREGRPVGEDFAFIRMRHGGPFGRGAFGPQFGPPFGPGGPRGRGRRRRGDVRAALLLLLGEGPSNGYQLMQTLEEKSDGRWRPSPGSVYPALAQLQDEGLITAVQSESEPGNVYEITDAGKQHLADRGEHKPPWEDEEDASGDSLAALRHVVISTGKAAWQVAQDGDEQQIAKAVELLGEARRGLYRLLAGDAGEADE